MDFVQCNHCGGKNPPEARFCIFCGSPLTIAEGGSPQEKSRIIENEIKHLRNQVALITRRLDALEQSRDMVPAPPPPAAAPVSPEPAPPEAAAPAEEAVPVPAETVPPPEEAPAEVEAKPAPAKRREWEQVLGGNWLARIGVLALIIGMGFFLKYAFDNNWIGPSARVVVGVVAGLVMLGLGNWWRTRYPILTRVLSGGGIAVLYLSIFASFATYHLISIYLAIVFLVVISVISTVLARRYDSMALAILGILGAFFAPFILGAFEDKAVRAGGSGQAVQLLIYIIVIDLGVLLLSTFRNWRWFTLLSLGCSLITYGFWYGEFHRQVGIATAELGITGIFLMFVGATSLFHAIWRRIPQAFDYVLMVLTAAAYFGISLGLMWDEFRAWMGGFVLLLAIFYGLLSYFTYRRSPDNSRLSLFALGIGIVFLTTAVPVQLGDKAWTTIIWAAEFVLLVWLSFKLRMPSFRNYSYAVFLAMGLRLLAFDTTIDIKTFTPVINERFLAFIIGIAATYLTVYILWKQKESFPEWHIPASTLLVFASFFSIWILSFEVWQSFSSALRTAAPSAREGLSNAQNLSLTAVWAVYAVAGLVIGIWKHWRAVRIGSLALLAVPIVKVFIYDVFKLETSYRIGAFVGLGLLLLVSAYLYQRYSKIIKGVFTEK
jgi:uncharacterized membrane protein